MLKDKDRAWLRGRLERRAKDARQAHDYVCRLSPAGYPDAPVLAKAHAEAAAIYERALAELDSATP